MYRVLLFAITTTLLAGAPGFGQEQTNEPSPAERLSGFKPFFGEWIVNDAVPDLPPGQIHLSIQPILANSHVQIRLSFSPQRGDGFGLMQMTASWNAEHHSVRFQAANFDGSGSGTVSFEDGNLKIEGAGIRFNGDKIERKALYSRDGDNLVVQLTDTVNGKRDEQRFVLRPSSEVGPTAAARPSKSNAEELAKEIQGTWRLEQDNGRYSVKTISGLTGKLTRYDADGNVTHAHESEFDLSEHDGIRRFRLKKLTITAGPDKGMVVPEVFLDGYVYRIEGDEFIEAQGLEAGGRKMRVFRWKRVNDAGK